MIDVYVRIAVPNSQSNALANNYSSIGHYDLIIDDDVSFVGYFGINPDQSVSSIQRPVFSWGTNSKISIKPLISADVKPACSFYKWHLSVTQSDIDTLLSNLYSSVGSNLAISDTSISFTPSGNWSTYDVYSRNCFVAVSIWVQALGIVTLRDMVSASQSRRMYTRVLEAQIGDFADWTNISL